MNELHQVYMKCSLLLLFNDHLHLVKDFVSFGVIFGSRKERRNTVMRFSGVGGCRMGGEGWGEGEVFIEFRGGTGAWTQKSPGWSQIPLLGAGCSTRLLCVAKMTSSCTAYGGREGHTRYRGSY